MIPARVDRADMQIHCYYCYEYIMSRYSIITFHREMADYQHPAWLALQPSAELFALPFWLHELPASPLQHAVPSRPSPPFCLIASLQPVIGQQSIKAILPPTSPPCLAEAMMAAASPALSASKGMSLPRIRMQVAPLSFSVREAPLNLATMARALGEASLFLHGASLLRLQRQLRPSSKIKAYTAAMSRPNIRVANTSAEMSASSIVAAKATCCLLE